MGYIFGTLVNQMVIGIWKCDYESGFGILVNQMVIGFRKCNYESRKFGTYVVLKSKILFIVILICKLVDPTYIDPTSTITIDSQAYFNFIFLPHFVF